MQDKYYAKLNVTKGDWENACLNTQAVINKGLTIKYDSGLKKWTCDGPGCKFNDRDLSFSAQCVNRQGLDKGFAGMWLEVKMEDPACPSHWGTFERTCPEVGEARYEARLWDVPEKASWEEACTSTPADYLGDGITVLPRADQCIKDGLLGTKVGATGMWARFMVADESCVKKTFTDKERLGHCAATIGEIQRIWTPRLVNLQQAVARGEAAAPSNGGAATPEQMMSLNAKTIVEAIQQRHQGKLDAGKLATMLGPATASVDQIYDQAPQGPSINAPQDSNSDISKPGLIYSIGGAVSGGAFFGVSAEQGIAAWFDARENLRGYTSFSVSEGLQLGVGGETSLGIWVVNDLLALGGDSWGCSVGASGSAGVGAAFTAWFDYENNYLGSTLAPGIGVGIPVEGTLTKVHTFVY